MACVRYILLSANYNIPEMIRHRPIYNIEGVIYMPHYNHLNIPRIAAPVFIPPPRLLPFLAQTRDINDRLADKDMHWCPLCEKIYVGKAIGNDFRCIRCIRASVII